MLPADRQTGDAGQALAIERRRLAAIENGGDDVGSKIAKPKQHTEICTAYAERGCCCRERVSMGRFDQLSRLICSHDQLDERSVRSGTA